MRAPGPENLDYFLKGKSRDGKYVSKTTLQGISTNK